MAVDSLIDQYASEGSCFAPQGVPSLFGSDSFRITNTKQFLSFQLYVAVLW